MFEVAAGDVGLAAKLYHKDVVRQYWTRNPDLNVRD